MNGNINSHADESISPESALMAMQAAATHINREMFAGRVAALRHDAVLPSHPYDAVRYYRLAIDTLQLLGFPIEASEATLLRVEGGSPVNPQGQVSLLDAEVVGLGYNIERALQSCETLVPRSQHTNTYAASYEVDGHRFVMFGVCGGSNPETNAPARATVVTFLVESTEDGSFDLMLLQRATGGERLLREFAFLELLDHRLPGLRFERARGEYGFDRFITLYA